MGVKKFLIYFLVFNVVLAIAPAFVQMNEDRFWMLVPNFWLLFYVFSILTLSIYVMVHWFVMLSASPRAPGQALLGAIIGKFAFCVTLVFIYLSKVDVNPVLFLLNFFYLYFFHTAFEIYCLLRNLRNQISK